ncbi:Hypothetical predicted protein [Paramuricea clavata]|uniref:Uncharacterized protein n=1 Tax=Paramuricea clavata TaxID=317549 RepID=A0A6S7JFP2_PARCT|nr:Hypothetical predicted protein [Paramuricea clavata]
MEWCEKEQKLKERRGKKIPICVAISSTYTILCREAEHKWKNFHSDLYDKSQQYHLLYEDGQQAVFIPAEGLLDDENVDDDCDIIFVPSVRTLSNVSDDGQENDKPAKRPRHNSSISIDLTTAPTQDDRYNNEQSAVPSDDMAKESSESPPSIVGIVKMLAEKVDPSDKQLFIVLRRNAQLNRVLSIWSREIKRKPVSS